MSQIFIHKYNREGGDSIIPVQQSQFNIACNYTAIRTLFMGRVSFTDYQAATKEPLEDEDEESFVSQVNRDCTS